MEQTQAARFTAGRRISANGAYLDCVIDATLTNDPAVALVWDSGEVVSWHRKGSTAERAASALNMEVAR